MLKINNPLSLNTKWSILEFSGQKQILRERFYPMSGSPVRNTPMAQSNENGLVYTL